MSMLKRLLQLGIIVVFTGLLAFSLAIFAHNEVRAIGQSEQNENLSVPGTGFIIQFNPAITQFQVITLPGVSRQPHSLAVISRAGYSDIWYTDPGTDRIGRLTYTDTNTYAFTEFDATDFASLAGSEPFDLAADSKYIWFTARAGDWIGRVNITTTEFISIPLTAGSAPWSIDLSPDGSIWFTEKEANKLGNLIVTDTTHYNLVEYTIPDSNSQPQGLAVVNANEVWIGQTAPANNTRIRKLIPGDNDFSKYFRISGVGHPVNLTSNGTDLWMTELLGNNVSYIMETTVGGVFPKKVPTAYSQPYDLVIDRNKDVWFTERTGQKLGQYQTKIPAFTEYNLPSQVKGIFSQGIDIDTNDNLWVAGFFPEKIYLPVVVKDS